MHQAGSMDHNKLIAAKAKESLKPLKFKRVGKSRLWIKDNGWWVVIVEFQPSSWSKGTYVNVNVSNLLYEREGWAFYGGDRIPGFASVENDPDFESKVESMAAQAASYASELDERYSSLESFVRIHSDKPEDRKSVWDYFFAGVLCSLMGDIGQTRRNFTAILEKDQEQLFQQGVQLKAAELMFLLDHPEECQRSIMGIVLRARRINNMKGYDIHNIKLPWADNA